MTLKLGAEIKRALALLAVVLGPTSAAQVPGDWWPDPTTNRGLSVWLTYSRDYDTVYSNLDTDPKHEMLVEAQIAELGREQIEVVFVALSSRAEQPHVQSLSDPESPVSRDLRSFLNRLNASKSAIRGCAAILSDNFTGDSLERYVLVDDLIDFNANLDPTDAPLRCVSTDLEMPPGSHRLAVYDLWKQFHLNMKLRIAESGAQLPLLAWMQGPDYLVSQLSAADQEELRQREGVEPVGNGLFTGAIRYFTTQDGQAIFDAVIPMWYFASQNPYATRLEHNFQELTSIEGEKPFLIAGIMIRNDTGLCCRDNARNPVCIRSRAEYEDRLAFDDTFRAPASVFIGTGVFRWPVPADWNCRLGDEARCN